MEADRRRQHNDQIDLLLERKQDYFLRYYKRVVENFPLGIEATEVKRIVGTEIQEKFGFDPFDPMITGTNPSTGRSTGSQWANNLVSNRVLDGQLLVSRGGSRIMLYPYCADNSIPMGLNSETEDGEGGVDGMLRETADERMPVPAFDRQPLLYLRSPALAAWVRREADYSCSAGSEECITFLGKDGRPYIEVHHLIPMAEQFKTEYNLDRTANMVALCPGCHVRLHRGDVDVARSVLQRTLNGYEELRGVELQQALSGCDRRSDMDSLLSYYGHS